MPQPFSLSTARPMVRPFVQDDLDDLLRFHRNPALDGYDPEGKRWSDGAIAQRLESYIAAHEKQGFELRAPPPQSPILPGPDLRLSVAFSLAKPNGCASVANF